MQCIIRKELRTDGILNHFLSFATLKKKKKKKKNSNQNLSTY